MKDLPSVHYVLVHVNFPTWRKAPYFIAVSALSEVIKTISFGRFGYDPGFSM